MTNPPDSATQPGHATPQDAPAASGPGRARGGVLGAIVQRNRIAVPADRQGGATDDTGRVLAVVRLALGRAALGVARVPLDVRSLEARKVALADVVELTRPGMFIALIEGAGDRLGVMLMDPAVHAALVEAQTLGHVTPAAAPVRRPTLTDSSLLAPVIDHVLTGLDGPSGEAPGEVADWLRGFVYASHLTEPRPLGLMLDEEVEYHLLIADVAIGEKGEKQGLWHLLFPARDAAARRAASGHGSASDPVADPAQQWAGRMERTVMASTARLDAVLHRFTMPLRKAMTLTPGTVLEMPMSALEAIRLETACGQELATGRLGQSRGARAIRLTSTTLSAESKVPVQTDDEAGAGARLSVPDARAPDVTA